MLQGLISRHDRVGSYATLQCHACRQESAEESAFRQESAEESVFRRLTADIVSASDLTIKIQGGFMTTVILSVLSSLQGAMQGAMEPLPAIRAGRF